MDDAGEVAAGEFLDFLECFVDIFVVSEVDREVFVGRVGVGKVVFLAAVDADDPVSRVEEVGDARSDESANPRDEHPRGRGGLVLIF